MNQTPTLQVPGTTGATSASSPIRWSQLLGLTLAYFGLAQLSLQLAVTPALAVPLWPAAGIALLGLLAWGKRYWPAVWAGSYAAELLHWSLLQGGQPELPLVALAATHATGATLQALLGAWALRPAVNSPAPLERERDVLVAITLGAPAASFVSATFGITGLHLFLDIPTDALPAIWVIWWAGDSLGVLLNLPLLLPLLPDVRQQWRGRELQVAALPVLTCALLLGGYVWLERDEHAAWSDRIASAAQDIRDSLALRLTRQTQRVLAVSDLFAAGGQVERDEFDRFARRTLTTDGLYALAWAPRVTGANRAAVEAAARRQGLADFAFREKSDDTGALVPASAREEYFPFLFVATPSGISNAFGVDLGADTSSRAAMRRAADEGRPVWAERNAFYDYQDQTRRDDWRLFAPVYQLGFDPGSGDVAARRKALRGFAVGVFYLAEIFASVGEHASGKGVVYRISSHDELGTRRVLFVSDAAFAADQPAHWSSTIEGIDGDQLQMEAWPTTTWHPGQSRNLALYLAGAVAVMLFVVVFVLVAAGQGARIRRRVQERTAELQASEALLERVLDAAQLGYWDWDLTSNEVTFSERWFGMLGYGPGDLKSEHGTWNRLLHPEDREQVLRQLNDHLEGRSDSYRVEFRLRTKAGGWRWIASLGNVTHRDADGRALHMSGIHADIQGRKEAEIALEESRGELRAINEHLEQLIFEKTAELQESERFARASIDALSSHVAVLDREGRVLATNRACRAFAAKNPDARCQEGEGANYLEFCDRAGGFAATLGDLIRDVIGGARAEACFEYPCPTSQGTAWFICWITRFPGEGPVRIVLAHENITPRKLAEQATEEMARELKATLKAIPDLLLELDEHGVYHHVWASDAALAAAATEHLLGHSVTDQLPPDAAQTVFDAMREATAAGLSRGRQIRLPSPKGNRWFDLSVAAKEVPSGAPRRFIVLSRNVTQRKAAEDALRHLNDELESKIAARTADLELAKESLDEKGEMLRSVIDHLADCIVTTDEQGVIRSANHAVEKIFGYPVEDVIGRNITLLIPIPARENHARRMEEYRRTGKSRIIGLRRHVEGLHKCGEPIMLELAISEYAVRGRRYFTGIMRDVREQLRIMADMEQARKDAEHANQAKSAFLATMSHEIRTPMNGVIGMIDVLQQTQLKRHQLEMVDIIRDSAISLLGIIEDILDFSKIEAGKLELEVAPMAVSEVVENVCAMLDHLADRQAVELTLFTDPAIPARVLGDPLRLRQVLINLANNAIKFSAATERPGRVSVRALLEESQGGRVVVEIRVADNGIGMDEAARTRLFTAFTQADASTTRRFGGTGLGLAICRELVSLMGGRITVDSERGKGSVFTVHLPFRTAPDAGETEDRDPHLAGMPCLVVGDGDSLADDFATYLASAGALVSRVPGLADARQRIDGREPGQWVWIVDAVSGLGDLDDLRALSRSRPGLDLRFVIVDRGRRRRPRTEAPDLVRVDGNILGRKTLLEAVAAASGRGGQPMNLPPTDKAKVPLRAPSRDEARRHGRLILVAEDNETNQKVIVHQLTLLGYAVDVAGNGRGALERWRSGDYGLLLTDLHMPEMDGYQLTRAIRAEERNRGRLPIVALTANSLRGEAQRCKDAGMDDYLSKPTQLSTLKETLMKWLPEALATPPAAARSNNEAASPPVDIGVLAALVGNEPSVLAEFLQDFRTTTAKAAAELRAAETAGDAIVAGHVAHRLKSSARSVGAIALGELCAQLENAAKDEDSEQAMTLLKRIAAEIAVVEAYLSSAPEILH